MGRSPCCTKEDGLNKGAWTALEDKILTDFIKANGEGKWRSIPKKAGLKRCGKSCRLRWLNYLRPDIKRGNITSDEEDLIVRLHKLLGNRWSLIAGRLPGRTDNEIKNYWNSNLAKKEQRKYVLQRSPIKEKTPVASVTQEKTPKLVSVGPSVLHDSQVIAPMEPTLLAPAVPVPVVSCEMVNSVQLSGYESSNVSSPASMSLEDPNAELTKDSTVGDLQITEIHDFTDFRFTEFGVAQLDVVKEENVNSQCIESDNNVGSSGGQAHWFSIERLMMDNWAFDIETNLDLGTLDSIPHIADDWII